MSLWNHYLAGERKLSHFLKGRSITLLAWFIGFIYIWYGVTKLMGISPISELVQKATHWISVDRFCYFLGTWEILIGLFLWIRPLRRYGLWLLFLHFPGTFLPLFTNPEDCFTAFPYGLTLEGQYIFKNLITFAAALVLVSQLSNDEVSQHNPGDQK